MNWRPILAVVVRFAAITAAIQTGTIFVCSHWFWTPVQRHYLPAYIWCSLPVITPATAEVRVVWKTRAHRKWDLAANDDAVDSEGGMGMKLSQSALDAGWTGLAEGPPPQFSAATLRRDLADFAFGGGSLWSFLLLPEACGLVAFCYGLYGCIWLGDRILGWAAELNWKRRQSPWEESPPSLFDRCSAMGRGLHSRLAKLHRSARKRIEMHRSATTANAAVAETPVRPASFALPLFGVHNGTGDGYLWSERDEIE